METKSIRPKSAQVYAIHSSKTGDVILSSIELDSAEIESLSSDSAEGHFLAGNLANDELVNAGLPRALSVFAIVK
jgi:hypothetical protein